jgi:DNA-binding transcriptional MerR regulator
VSDRTPLPLKLYYRIGEVASVVGVETHVLRYWESEFPTIRPQKSSKGHRVYSRKDVEKLLRVKQLLYSEGYTVQGAKRRLHELSRARGGVDGSPLAAGASVPMPEASATPPEVASAQVPTTVPAPQHAASEVVPPAEPRFEARSVLPIRAIPRPAATEVGSPRPTADETHLREALLALRRTLVDELATFSS